MSKKRADKKRGDKVELGPAGPSRVGGKFAPGWSGNPGGKRRDAAPTPPANLTPGGHQRRADGFTGSHTGFGVPGVDKREGHLFVPACVSYQDAINLWRGNHIAAKAVELVPAECYRMGYEITVADEEGGTELAELIEEKLKDLGANHRMKRAHELERGLGGGAVLIGANDGQDLDKPLDLDRIITLDWLTALEPGQIWPSFFYGDAQKPKYGEPSMFQLSANAFGPTLGGATSSNGMVHESRVVAFRGIRVSRYQDFSATTAGMYWGDSIFVRFVEVLRDFCLAAASIGIVVTDFTQLVVQVENLAALLAEDNGLGFERRMRAMNNMRSSARAVIADIKEKVSRESASVAGLRDLADWLSANLAGSVGIPLTKLMGTSPKGGLGSEGGLDERWFYGEVANVQIDRHEPPLRKVISAAFRTIGDRVEPEKWDMCWRSLWQPSDLETAQARALQSNIDHNAIQDGVLSARDVRRARYGGAKYSFETQVDLTEYDEQDALASEPQQPGDLAALAGAMPGQEPAAPGEAAATPIGVLEQTPEGHVRVKPYLRRRPIHAPPPGDPSEPDPNTPDPPGRSEADAALTASEWSEAAQASMASAREAALAGDYEAADEHSRDARAHARQATKAIRATAVAAGIRGVGRPEVGGTADEHATAAQAAHGAAAMAMASGDFRGAARMMKEARGHLKNAARAAERDAPARADEGEGEPGGEFEEAKHPRGAGGRFGGGGGESSGSSPNRAPAAAAEQRLKVGSGERPAASGPGEAGQLRAIAHPEHPGLNEARAAGAGRTPEEHAAEHAAQTQSVAEAHKAERSATASGDKSGAERARAEKFQAANLQRAAAEGAGIQPRVISAESREKMTAVREHLAAQGLHTGGASDERGKQIKSAGSVVATEGHLRSALQGAPHKVTIH